MGGRHERHRSRDPPRAQGCRDRRLAPRKRPSDPRLVRDQRLPRRRRPWRNEGFALSRLEQVVAVRKGNAKTVADRMLGVLHTTWCDFGSFLKAYRGEETGVQAKEAVACFKALMRAARAGS